VNEDFEQILGQKVILRRFLQSDITPQYISWLNDPEVVRYSEQRFIRHTKTSCLAYWDSFLRSPNLFLIVKTLSDDMPVGTMTAYVSSPHGTVDIGILIGRKSVWGSGVGQDAWNTLVNWFIERRKISKVTAGALSDNKAMIRIMERSGMRLISLESKLEQRDGMLANIGYFCKDGHQSSQLIEGSVGIK